MNLWFLLGPREGTLLEIHAPAPPAPKWPDELTQYTAFTVPFNAALVAIGMDETRRNRRHEND